MADPTITECDAQLAAKCALLEKARLAGKTQTQNVVGLIDADQQGQEGDYADEAVAVARQFRQQYAATVSDESARAMLSGVLQNYGIVIGSVETDPAAILADLHKYFDSIGVAAVGTLTLDTEPADADTMTVGATTYRFKTVIAAANDILRGDGKAAVQARIVQVLNGDGGAVGTDFYAGTTTPNATAKCGAAFVADVLTITARTKGTTAVPTTETFTAGTNVFNGANLGATTAGVAPRTVQRRAFSYGSVTAAAANVGDGTIVRCTTDERGYAIESGWADTVTVECVASNSNRHEEAFRIRGLRAGVDRLAERGSGKVTALRALSSRDSRRLLSNESFDLITSATNADGEDLTSLGGWITSDGTLTNLKLASGTARVYRQAAGISAPKSLDLRASRRIYQVLKPGLDYSKPHVLQIAALPENSAGGLLCARFRSYTTPASRGPILAMSSVVVTGTAWQLLRLIAWPRVFAAGNDIALELEWSRTAGNLLLDDGVLAPMTEHDSLWYAALGGQSRFVADDSYSFTDTETGSIIQRWLHRGYRRHLPHAASAPTVTEPTVT